MSLSFTTSESTTFTLTHAKHIAAKVATDLKRMQRFYNSPSNAIIEAYETEIIELLKKGYLDTVTYGFQRDGKWIEPTLRYSARTLNGDHAGDDDPGKVVPYANIEGASFGSFLTYSPSWDNLSTSEQDVFKNTLPFQRRGSEEPRVNGYMNSDKTYSSGGRALDRSTVKSY
jgi:Bacterial HORMA domain family 1